MVGKSERRPEMVKFEMHAEKCADGFYAVVEVPEQIKKEPTRVGPYATEAEAGEQCWRFADTLRGILGEGHTWEYVRMENPRIN
jgi:hypothetical protein